MATYRVDRDIINKRVPLKKGKYTTIANKILLHKELSSDAKVFIQVLLNYPKEGEENSESNTDLLEWDNIKETNVIMELMRNGFMALEKYRMVNRKSFHYVHIHSEYGDLGG